MTRFISVHRIFFLVEILETSGTKDKKERLHLYEMLVART